MANSPVFLVSGGAKGITAKCVIKLAQHCQCKFILIGRSALDEGPEPAWAMGGYDEAALKKAAMQHLAAAGQRPTPRAVQQAVDSLLSRREIEATLRAIEQAGGQAHYLSVDITNGPNLQKQVAAATQQLGPVTGLIHGAGNLADKLIEKKTDQDFEAVYAAKVKGLENLLNCVPPGQLDYLVLFSSVAGFYGNIGQADYAIANEILNKAAHLIKYFHPACRVVSINWGPWDGGMVTPEIKRQFAERNIAIIPVEMGARLLVEELTRADCDSPQIVIGSRLAPPPTEPPPALQTYRIQRPLSLTANPFLQAHVIGGQPVLPSVCAIGWMVNAGEQLYPGYRFVRYENYQALKGIVFDDSLADAYLLELEETDKSDGLTFSARISSQAERPRYHYQARIHLRRQMPEPPLYPAVDLAENKPLPGPALYEDGVLFHAPALQGIERLLNISPTRLTMRCRLPALSPTQQGQFPVQTFNPYTADIQLQSLVVWAWHFYQAGSLPLRIEQGEQFRPLPFDHPFYVSLEIQNHNEHKAIGHIVAHDAEGRLYARMQGAEVTISPRLNERFQQNQVN